MNIRQLVVLLEECVSKKNKIILFGAASSGERGFLRLVSFGFEQNHFIFCDSNPKKFKTYLRGIAVESIETVSKLYPEATYIVTSVMHYEIIPMLQNRGVKKIFFSQELIFDRTIMPRYSDSFVKSLNELSEITNVSMLEAWNLETCVESTAGVSGCLAEVGVYKGGTAAILSKNLGKHLHLFDTFAGLPPSKVKSDDLVASGWLDDVSPNSVLDLVGGDIYMHVGVFPETTLKIKCHSYSMVHLDTDIFESTLDGLNYFFPKLNKGGIIIVHDFNNEGCPGVKRAVNKFLKENIVPFSVELAETQILLQK